jgi:uncharacterized membrane protein
MDKLIVAVFPSESVAYEGLRALRDLDTEGSLSLYASAVIAKDDSGGISIKQAADRGPLGTAVGLLSGTLVGLVTGPVGFLAGLTAGVTGGALYDIARAGISADFLDDTAAALKNGSVAVLAEVWEEWTTPLDTRIEKLGGVLLRRVRGEYIDDQIAKDAAALHAEITGLKEEMKTAAQGAQDRLSANLARARGKAEAEKKLIEHEIESGKVQAEAKVKVLQERIARASGVRKAKLEAKLTDLRARGEQRRAKLAQAWELIKQALEVT